MGYRSEVAFAIHPDKVSEFLAVLSTSKEALELCQGYPGHDKGMQTDVFMKGDLFVEMSGIKWYEGYKGVDVIDKFIADTIDEVPLEEGGPQGHDFVRFIRVGEEYEDVVQCGDYAYDFLRIQPASIYVEEQL